MLRMLIALSTRGNAVLVAEWLAQRLAARPEVAADLPELQRRLVAANPPFDLVLLEERLCADPAAIACVRDALDSSPDTGLILISEAADPSRSPLAARTGPCSVISPEISPEDLLGIVTTYERHWREFSMPSWLEVLARNSELLQRAVDIHDVDRQTIQGGRELGFERVRLWELVADARGGRWLSLIGQAGNRGLDSRAGYHIPCAQSHYAQVALASDGPCYFNGQDEGVGYLEQDLAAAGYKPPLGEWALLPLRSDGDCWGLMALDNADRPRRISREQRTLLALFGRQVAIGRERARLYERERRRVRELELLNRVAKAVAAHAASDDLAGLLHAVWRHVGELVDARNFMVVLMDSRDGMLDYRLHIRDGAPRPAEMRLPAGTLVGHVIAGGTLLHLADGCGHYRADHGLQQVRHPSLCYLALPLTVEARTVGAVVLQSFGKTHAFSPEDVRLLELVVGQVAAAIEGAYVRALETKLNERIRTMERASAMIVDMAGNDRRRFWHMALTVATADYGLGFNRAMLFLAEEQGTRLRGFLGIGCANAMQALEHWTRDTEECLDFERYLQRLYAGRIDPAAIEPEVRRLVLPLADADHALAAAFRDGHPRVVPAAAAASTLPAAFVAAFGATDYALLPIRDSGGVVGLLTVDNRFNQEPLRPSLLNQLEVWLSQVALANEIVQQRRNRDHLLTLTHEILAGVREHSLAETLERIALSAQEVTGADCVLVYPFVPHSQREFDTRNVGRVGLRGAGPFRERLNARGISMQVASAPEPVVVRDVAVARDAYHKCLAGHPFLHREEIRAFIGVAIRDPRSAAVTGVLYLNYRAPRDFSEADCQLAEAFASLAAMAIRHAYAHQRTLEELIAAQDQNQARDRELSLTHKLLEAALDQENPAEHTAQVLLQVARDILDLPELSVGLLLLTSEVDTPEGQSRAEIRRSFHLLADGRFSSNEETHALRGITGEVFQTGCTRIAADVRRGRWRDIYYEGMVKGTVSEMDVPISHEGRVIGVFNLESPHHNAFTPDHQAAMERVALAARLPLVNSRRRDEQQRTVIVRDAALRIARDVGSKLALDDALYQIHETLRRLFPRAAPCVLVYQDDDERLVFTAASRAFYAIDLPGYTDLASVSIAGPGVACAVARETKRTGRMAFRLCPDVSAEPAYWPLRSTTRSELCISLVHAERLQGVLLLESDRPNDFSLASIATAKFLVDLIGATIERAAIMSDLQFKNQLLSLTAFAALIAHDLNREIGAIRNRTYWLKQRRDLTEQEFSHLREIDESADRLRGATATFVEPRRTFSLDRRVALDVWLEPTMRAIAGKHSRVRVSSKLRCPGHEVLLAESLLRQAVEHLARNAIRAMNQSGLLEISTARKGDQIEVRIADSGPGVPAALQPRLFHEPLPNADGQGGLGLLIVRLIVELHGGRIRLVNDPGEPDERRRGAVFAFTLPLAEREEP